MKRLLGITLMVVILCGILIASDPGAASPQNLANLARRVGFFGILTLGAGILIIAGGIDLSIGSVVGLSAISFGLLLEQRFDPWLSAGLVLLGASVLGLCHGLLVTKLRLQPFIVTLCGLFIYRGLAQLAPVLRFRALLPSHWGEPWLHGSSRDVGIGGRPDLAGIRFLAAGDWLGVPMMFWLLLGLAFFLGLMLHGSVYGRYLYALGANEQAARYAGIATDRYKIVAFVLCSLLAGLGGLMLLLDLETAQPSAAGSWYELYAITGAVLGGCSLRGGQGLVAGILLGTAVLPLLRNLCIFAGVPSDLEYTVIGLSLLLGTIADEILKRRGSP
ncbi:MAG: ABC transporter permease [Gemmataceae bacterium]|nr:ABC transporter permease [Gemmataceae bacterium]MDW8264200.1 ABC transporter permease [Gemmataceae bacterium]